MKKICCSILMMVLSACSTQQATEEDYLRGADGEAFGPGIFSGDSGAIDLTEAFSDVKSRGGVGGATAYDVDLPAMDQKSFNEYERFKEWRRAQQPGSAEFKEYQQWLEYKK
jgi:hypothetical protein